MPDTFTQFSQFLAESPLTSTDRLVGWKSGVNIQVAPDDIANYVASSTALQSKANAAALGVAGTADNMGTFTGSTIPDNVSAKTALQSLETPLEALESREVVSVAKYGAMGDGSDQTAAVQACLTANPGALIRVPKGVYFYSATLYGAPNTQLVGDDPDNTIFYRTGNYGSTIVFGSSSQGAGSFGVTGIWFKHGDFANGATTINYPVTQGAHIEAFGAQNCNIEKCYFWRMRFNIALHGGSIIHIDNCTFLGIYNTAITGGAECIGSVWCDPSTAQGNVKDLFLTRNSFLGALTAVGNYTYTDSNGHSVTVSMQKLVGPFHTIHVEGCETITATSNYFGGAADACFALIPSSAGFVANVRICDNLFDGAGNWQIYAQPQTGGPAILNLTIADNNFNGEFQALHSIGIIAQGSNAAVYTAEITGNTSNATIGAPLIITGLVGGDISNNTLGNYNCLGVTPSSPIDAQFGAAGYISNAPGTNGKIKLDGNTIGGGGNTLTDTSYCWLPFYKDSASTAVHIGKTTYMGVAGKVGLSYDNPVFVTGTTYTANAFDRTLFCTNSAARAITLPTNCPEGAELMVKDVAGTAGTANITVSGGTFDGASSAVISTNKGVLRLKCAGGSVWYTM
jgi:hypothetical protein